jgi:hypothetical protein
VAFVHKAIKMKILFSFMRASRKCIAMSCERRESDERFFLSFLLAAFGKISLYFRGGATEIFLENENSFISFSFNSSSAHEGP